MTRRFGRSRGSLATPLLALLLSATASAPGLGSMAAVQQLHGEAARATIERDCEERYRSFLARTAQSPSQRKRTFAACLDGPRGFQRVYVAHSGD